MPNPQSKYSPRPSASKPPARPSDRLARIAAVANLPVQTVQKYYQREQIPKALVSRIQMAEVMLGGVAGND